MYFTISLDTTHITHWYSYTHSRWYYKDGKCVCWNNDAYIPHTCTLKTLDKPSQEAALVAKTAAETRHTIAETNKEDSGPAPASTLIIPATTTTTFSQQLHLQTTIMEVSDSEHDGDFVESELITCTELDRYDSDGQDYCMYRHDNKQMYVAVSSSPNYSATGETLPTHPPVSSQENYTLRLHYTHMIGHSTMYNCLEFNGELLSGKEY